MSQIPGPTRKVRAVMDWTVGLPFERDIAEVGLDRPSAPLRADRIRELGCPPNLERPKLSARSV